MERKNLKDVVIDYIIEQILTGNYKKGARVYERKLADELNLSRAPIREAIAELQSLGLLIVEPRRGAHVADLSVEDAQEIFEIRVTIESQILELLVKNERLNDEDFDNLMVIIDEMIKVTQSDLDSKEMIYQFNLKDIEFHKYLWNKSKSKLRRKILNDIFLQLRLAMVLDAEYVTNLEISAKQHIGIIEALREKKTEKAIVLLKEHIESI